MKVNNNSIEKWKRIKEKGKFNYFFNNLFLFTIIYWIALLIINFLTNKNQVNFNNSLISFIIFFIAYSIILLRSWNKNIKKL